MALILQSKRQRYLSFPDLGIQLGHLGGMGQGCGFQRAFQPDSVRVVPRRVSEAVGRCDPVALTKNNR
ncbi:unnamed protein product [Protopolystoma xenopodis]|uniref:Uncharacterized protein n=1 Tax=Protopolystoma xenopodis TaxID=117903 RepID=A0A448WSN5_9PLAT|nr:unnamed protein product [Protopolystoma xenopodis]